jgi:peptidoglycan biosynthesis protein MviN/MurJ (putative lipid II flippase)
VNVLLNLILIPLYGSMGAAWSTLIAYVVLALVAYLVNQRIYPIPFEIGRFSVALVFGIALYSGVTFQAQQQGMYIKYLMYIGSVLFYGGGLVLIGKVPTARHKDRISHA